MAAWLLKVLWVLPLLSPLLASSDSSYAIVWKDVSPQRVWASALNPGYRYAHTATVACESMMIMSHGYVMQGAGSKDGTFRPTWLNDTWAFETISGRWYPLHFKGALPAGRMGASLVNWNNALYLFGGDDGGNQNSTSYVPGHYNIDLWRADLSETCAVPIEGAKMQGFPVMSWEQLKPSGIGMMPAARTRHSAVVFGDRMVIFGGLGYAIEKVIYLGDLWAWDFVANRWNEIRPEGPEGIPRARMCHTAVMLGGRMIVYGGFSGRADEPNYGDLWALDLEVPRWYPLRPVEGHVAPVPRGAHTAAADEMHQAMFIFGGGSRDPTTKTDSMNDIWRLDMRTLTWEEFKPRRDKFRESTLPHHRHFHTMVIIPASADAQSSRLYTYGGESYEPHYYFNDVWRAEVLPPSMITAASAKGDIMFGKGGMPSLWDVISGWGLKGLAVVVVLVWILTIIFGWCVDRKYGLFREAPKKRN